MGYNPQKIVAYYTYMKSLEQKERRPKNDAINVLMNTFYGMNLCKIRMANGSYEQIITLFSVLPALRSPSCPYHTFFATGCKERYALLVQFTHEFNPLREFFSQSIILLLF
jgi:hypothetical protein